MSYRHWLSQLACAVALTIAVPALGQNPDATENAVGQGEKTSDSDTKDQADQSNKDPAGAIPENTVQSIGIPTADSEDEKKTPKNIEPNETADVVGPIYVGGDTVAQWIVAAAGVIALGVSVWAVLLLRDTLKATRDAVEGARKATVAAEEAVEVTRKTAKHQLRPYISVTAGRIKGADTLIPTISIKFKNVGATPAFDVKHAMSVLTCTPGEESFDLSNVPFSYPTVVGPGIEISRTRERFSQDWASDRIEIALGEKFLYVFGRIEYRDAFQDHWWTSYRYELALEVGVSNDQLLAISSEGNDAT